MKFIKTAAVLCALLAAAPTFAQGNAQIVSAKESYNTLSVSYTDVTISPKEGTDTSLNGFSFGYLRGIGVMENHPLFIEAGIKFSMGFDSDTYDSDYDDITIKQTLASLAVPVNVAYKFNINDKFAIKPYVGLGLKLHVIGKYTLELDDEKKSLNWFDKKDMDGDAYKRFQLGWHLGVAFQYNRVSLGVDYGTDFIQFAKNVSSSTVNLNLGFDF